MQFGWTKDELIFQRLTKLHEPVGRAQFGVFEKFTSAYLFQIAQEKSYDHLLIVYMTKISRWLSRRNTRVSRNQGKIASSITPSWPCAWFESKRFDWPSVSFFDHWLIGILVFFSSFCTELTLFCTVKKKKNCSALNQSEWRNFFSRILLGVKQVGMSQIPTVNR